MPLINTILLITSITCIVHLHCNDAKVNPNRWNPPNRRFTGGKPNPAPVAFKPTTKKPNLQWNLKKYRDQPIDPGPRPIQISCRSGRALANVYWIPKKPNFWDFKVECVDHTSNCDDPCEWSLFCDAHRYGPTVYARGINVVYSNLMDQQYVVLLCCNSTNRNAKSSTTRYQCTGKFDALPGKALAPRHPPIYIRQIRGPYPFSARRTIWAETCKETFVGKLCPAAAVQNTKIGYDPALYKDDVLLGLLGLATGIAFVGGRSQRTPTVCTCAAKSEPCSSNQKICSGFICPADKCISIKP